MSDWAKHLPPKCGTCHGAGCGACEQTGVAGLPACGGLGECPDCTPSCAKCGLASADVHGDTEEQFRCPQCREAERVAGDRR